MTTFKLWVNGRERRYWCPFGLLEPFPWQHDSGCFWSKYFATGFDRSLQMERGFNHSLISRICENKATEYEILLYQIAIEHDQHLGSKVRALQCKWASEEILPKRPQYFERLRNANSRINKREKLPPWGAPLILGDCPPGELLPCRCDLFPDKDSWNDPMFYRGASNELRDALAKRAVRLGSAQAKILLKPPIPLRSPQPRELSSQELGSMVRTAAGSVDRRPRCKKLMTPNGCCGDLQPIDLIRLVATEEATADQKHVFEYNIKNNPGFASEIYYQQKTYRLNQEIRYEKNLLSVYRRCTKDMRVPPCTTERPQAAGNPARTHRPRPAALPRENEARRPNVPSIGETAARPTPTHRAGTSEPQPRRPVESGGSPPTQPETPAARAARHEQLENFTGFWSPPRQRQPESHRHRHHLLEPGQLPPQVLPQLPPSPVRPTPQTRQQDNFIIDHVVNYTATMVQLEVFEKRLVEDNGFHQKVIERLRILREQNAVEETGRLVKFINRIALWNLFHL